MGCGCFRGVDKKRDLLMRIEANVDNIEKIFNNVTFLIIVSEDGKIIIERGNQRGNKKSEMKHSKETAISLLIGPLNLLLKAALNFGAVAGVDSCEIMHIRGQNTIFSLYRVRRRVLAFQSMMPVVMASQFNTTGADHQMIPIMTTLRTLLDNFDELEGKKLRLTHYGPSIHHLSVTID
mmetsp:Transcript_16892/g.23635  ORF Transcript_16892/g.23635 Transcript_16892/m.23635 type:complete len:179 (+) Transcript_16892:144-680(+)|eukprot:CAMPEP_0185263204 /NCGR_PEP_ID=MMETSP1359-20130426/12668_1 /TAXON_ID=552665 /ORGANISM="Bigelowiella longifila, Strain CCMP242" /LENGTH=178 /DNA_ID=CAMNT_0027850485 /DNA_START=115 /DNA_END=651 /DNA_ORIENTATION=-